MPNFEDFLNEGNWKSLKDHYQTFPSQLASNIDEAIAQNKKIEMRKYLCDNFDIKKENLDIQKNMKTELLQGNTVGIDGTCVDCDFITGFQARIAIVAVNYKNNRTDYVTYISEPFIDQSKQDIYSQLEYLKKKGSGSVGISSSHIRAIMLFKERDFILNRKEKYKMVQGDILPYELRTGQGKLRGLSACLSLGKKLLTENNIIAVQGTTANPLFRTIGRALESGEYIELYDYYNVLNEFLYGDEASGKSKAHFNDQDFNDFRQFNEEVKNHFVVGIYKLKNRSYVFYAPKNNVDNMINLVLTDSKFQPMRGFPLLLDYADIICTHLFSAGEFKSMVEMKLALRHALEYELDERSMRRR